MGDATHKRPMEGKTERNVLKAALAVAMWLLALSAPAASAAPAPVAHYDFNLGGGTVLPDVQGENDGTIENGAVWTAGKYGSALSFDGQNDFVSVPDAGVLDFTQAFTVTAWVKPDTTVWDGLVVKATGVGTSTAAGYMLNAAGVAGKPDGYVANGSVSKGVTAPSALPVGTWSHLALTSDGTTLRLYLNAQQVASAPAIAATPTTANLEIGRAGGLLQWFFDGLIDEVRLYNVTLNRDEIQDTAWPDRSLSAKRTGAADRGDGTSFNKNFDRDAVNDYSIDADIAILDRGTRITTTNALNFAHKVDCAHPDPYHAAATAITRQKEGPYAAPDPEDPDWRPDPYLEEGEFGPYGCLENSGEYYSDQAGHADSMASFAGRFDGRSGLGSLAAGARIWMVRTIAGTGTHGGDGIGEYKNPVHWLPEHPEYDPEAPKWLPEVGISHGIAGLNWVTGTRKDQDPDNDIEVAGIWWGCGEDGHPMTEKLAPGVTVQVRQVT